MQPHSLTALRSQVPGASTKTHGSPSTQVCGRHGGLRADTVPRAHVVSHTPPPAHRPLPWGTTPFTLQCSLLPQGGPLGVLPEPLTREISAKCVFMSWSLTCTICLIPL